MSLNQKVAGALSLTGTQILTTYVAGSAFPASRAGHVEVDLTAVTLGSTNATSFQGKLQCSIDGTNDWTDVGTIDSSGGSDFLPVVEQTKNITSSQTVGLVFTLDRAYPFLRVAGKFTGGVGKTGETLSAFVRIRS